MIRRLSDLPFSSSNFKKRLYFFFSFFTLFNFTILRVSDYLTVYYRFFNFFKSKLIIQNYIVLAIHLSQKLIVIIANPFIINDLVIDLTTWGVEIFYFHFNEFFQINFIRANGFLNCILTLNLFGIFDKFLCLFRCMFHWEIHMKLLLWFCLILI